MAPLAQALLDRYRCLEEFLKFDLTGPLSETAGFFLFGPDTPCYGQSAVGHRKPDFQEGLYDILSDVSASRTTLQLPFDPTEIVENLQWERYANHERHFGAMRRSARTAYYFLRPFLNVPFRKHIQRLHVRGWKERRFPRWPVDRTVENIGERLLRLTLDASGLDRIPFIWFWPQGVSGCVMLTHDVESEIGLDFCSALMDMDDEFSLKASFQLVPEKRYKIPPQLRAEIRKRGFEVNIQDLNHDGRLFSDHDEFLRRAQAINRYAREYGAKGFRAAVLYRRPDWYNAFEFAFDMSVPNVAHLDPQRGGCCTIMPYFIQDILELPLTTTQDYMLFHLLGDYSISLWKEQTRLVLEKNGLLSFLVHPDYIQEKRGRGAYVELLQYLRDLRSQANLWFALPSQVNDWWRKRSKMKVVKHQDSWRIEGDDSGQAVLAYAVRSGDKLAYQFCPSTPNLVS
jgi:hypothetical protein